jgi:hypothetical protein
MGKVLMQGKRTTYNLPVVDSGIAPYRPTSMKPHPELVETNGSVVAFDVFPEAVTSCSTGRKELDGLLSILCCETTFGLE